MDSLSQESSKKCPCCGGSLLWPYIHCLRCDWDRNSKVFVNDLAANASGVRPHDVSSDSQQSFDPLGEAPESSITGALTSNLVEGGRETGGLDWLSLAVYGDWDTSKYWQLRRVLEAGKLKAQEGGAEAVFDLPEGGQAVVRPTGVRHGPIFAEWVIECEGVKLHISKRQFAHPTMPNLFIDVGSLALMQNGHVAMWEQIKSLLVELGFNLVRAVPSRVDLCVDRPGSSVQSYAEMFLGQRYICLAMTDCLYRERKKVTGLSFGKGIKCRIYDKLLEVRNNPEKMAVLAAKRWGGSVPECAARVEFQLRREEMKELFDIRDVDDLFAKLGAIAEYLTGKWLRFTAETVDRANNNQARAGVSSEWEGVRADFVAAFAPDRAINKRTVAAPQRKLLLKQAWGCLIAAMAAEGKVSRDYGEMQAWVDDALTESVETSWHVKLRIKAALFAAAFPGVVAGKEGADIPPI